MRANTIYEKIHWIFCPECWMTQKMFFKIKAPPEMHQICNILLQTLKGQKLHKEAGHVFTVLANSPFIPALSLSVYWSFPLTASTPSLHAGIWRSDRTDSSTQFITEKFKVEQSWLSAWFAKILEYILNVNIADLDLFYTVSSYIQNMTCHCNAMWAPHRPVMAMCNWKVKKAICFD